MGGMSIWHFVVLLVPLAAIGVIVWLASRGGSRTDKKPDQ